MAENRMFLGNLPKKYGIGANKNKLVVDWNNVKDIDVEAVYNDKKYNIRLIEFFKDTRKMKCKYKDIEKMIPISSLINCKIGNLVRTNLYNIGDLINGYIITDKLNSESGVYKIKCNKCGFDSGKHYSLSSNEYRDEYWISSNHIKRGDRCPCCCPSPKIVVQGINDMYTTDHWMVELGVDEEFAKTHTARSNLKAPCVCPHCGEKFKKQCLGIYVNKSIGCSCGDGFSYPEKFMCNILKQLGVKFETQYSPEYLKLNGGQKRSDFYIPSLNLVIETDGRLGHEGGIVHGKSPKTLEEEIKIDNWKDEQHMLHGVETIRINCFESDMEYIRESILNSELVNYFDFGNINWLKCEEFALKNIVKEVCNYWNNKKEWETTKDLAEKFNVEPITIRQYLKQGTRLGWCDYDPSLQYVRSDRCGRRKKPVEVFRDGVSLGKFESASELSRQSLNVIGIKLCQGSISKSCKTGNKHNNLMFKYI